MNAGDVISIVVLIALFAGLVAMQPNRRERG